MGPGSFRFRFPIMNACSGLLRHVTSGVTSHWSAVASADCGTYVRTYARRRRCPKVINQVAYARTYVFTYVYVRTSAFSSCVRRKDAGGDRPGVVRTYVRSQWRARTYERTYVVRSVAVAAAFCHVRTWARNSGGSVGMGTPAMMACGEGGPKQRGDLRREIFTARGRVVCPSPPCRAMQKGGPPCTPARVRTYLRTYVALMVRTSSVRTHRLLHTGDLRMPVTGYLRMPGGPMRGLIIQPGHGYKFIRKTDPKVGCSRNACSLRSLPFLSTYRPPSESPPLLLLLLKSSCIAL